MINFYEYKAKCARRKVGFIDIGQVVRKWNNKLNANKINA